MGGQARAANNQEITCHAARSVKRETRRMNDSYRLELWKQLPKLLLLVCVTFVLPTAGSVGMAYGPELPIETETAQLEQPPNVLFVAVDDMKDWIGCLGGYQDVVTPNIDRLAARGMLFTNAHCASPKCAPSRAAILTGKRPSTTGLYDNGHWWRPNYPDLITLPAYFRSRGYHVAGAGKIFHHTAGNNPPDQWDEYLRLTFRNDPWFRGVKLNYPWSEFTDNPAGFPFSGVPGLGHENDWGSLPISDAEYDDEITVDFGVGYLKRAHHQPFFLAIGIFRPHLPWYVPQRYFELYPMEQINLPEVLRDDLADVPAVGLEFAQARQKDFLRIREAQKYRHAVQAYLASISYADAQLGRLLNALESSSVNDNTIVVFWSDHGWHLGEKGHWHKSTLWEEATRVPLVISTPDHSSGKCSRPVSLLDIFPTLLELTRQGNSAQPNDGDSGSLDGVSLVPLLEDPTMQWDRPAVIEYQRGNAAVRSERHRYIRYHDGGEELYDLVSDPEEWMNVAEDPDHAATKARLAKWLPKSWAPSALTKKAFVFDPKVYQWRNKETGDVVSGDQR